MREVKITEGIEIKVDYDGYDFNITDIYHPENSITITKMEAKYLVKEIKLLLKAWNVINSIK